MRNENSRNQRNRGHRRDHELQSRADSQNGFSEDQYADSQMGRRVASAKDYGQEYDRDMGRDMGRDMSRDMGRNSRRDYDGYEGYRASDANTYDWGSSSTMGSEFIRPDFTHREGRDFSRREESEKGVWESVKDFFGVGPKGYSRSDARIHEDVSDALMHDRSVDASQIEVEVTGGKVVLRGSVTSKWMKRRAEDCAEDISGVKDVHNEIAVKKESFDSFFPTDRSVSGMSSAPSASDVVDGAAERKRKLS